MEKKFADQVNGAGRQWPQSQPLRVMFQDEARFGRISDTRYCWAKRPHRPTVPSMVTQQYVYAYGAVSPKDGRFDSLVLPRVNADCMHLFVAEIARRYPEENILMVLDGAGWHKGEKHPLPDNVQLLFLPPYSPQLNPQENLWDELREKHFHNRVFEDLDSLQLHLITALTQLEQDTERIKSITGWEWIISAI